MPFQFNSGLANELFMQNTPCFVIGISQQRLRKKCSKNCHKPVYVERNQYSPLNCVTAQYNQTIYAVKSHFCALTTFQTIGKAREYGEAILIKCIFCSYFYKNLYLF